MHRIDHPTAVDIGGGKSGFIERDPTGGTPGTIVTDDWQNATQEELCLAIEEAGISLVKGTNNQLISAIRTLSEQLTRLSFPGAAEGGDKPFEIMTFEETLDATAISNGYVDHDFTPGNEPNAQDVLNLWVAAHDNSQSAVHSHSDPAQLGWTRAKYDEAAQYVRVWFDNTLLADTGNDTVLITMMVQKS